MRVALACCGLQVAQLVTVQMKQLVEKAKARAARAERAVHVPNVP